MGNISSQSGHLKYRQNNPENLQWAHSFPRTQTRFQQNQMKVLPEKTPKIRLRHTENGEILQTGGTLTGRQIQIKKCGSEPHLHRLAEMHNSTNNSDSIESEKERKFRKKYKAPPPPNQDGKYCDNAKPRLFKTKIQSERKRSMPEYQDKSNYSDSPPLKSLDNDEKFSYAQSHRLSLPALNTQAWDFQGELKEATRRLRKMKSKETGAEDEEFSSFDDATKREKLKTLDHHIDKNDLIKLKGDLNHVKNKNLKNNNEPASKLDVEKSQPPKTFYFGMSSKLEQIQKNKKTYADSEVSSTEEKHKDFDSDLDESFGLRLPTKSREIQRFSPVAKWRQQSSSVESVINQTPSRELKYSSEENEEPSRVFSIFPTRSGSNDRSRSGDSGISGDGSPAVFEDNSDHFNGWKTEVNKSLKSILHGWTPQQDLGDDSSFEEESFSAEDYTEPYENQLNQRHVFSLSLPRDHQLAAYGEQGSSNETNFEKIRRSVSGILNTINKKEAESTPENEKGNWFLNKSCSALNSSSLVMKYSQISDELDEYLSRNTKINSGRCMYLPKVDKPHTRPRRYETRNHRQKSKEENNEYSRMYASSSNINETKSNPVPENLQDTPVLKDKKTFKKKPKRFTFQSTIRQIERRRIAEKLSREAEKKEQQRLRELEIMQKVEREFQQKRAREKVNIKQQLNRYSNYQANIDSASVSPTLNEEHLEKDIPSTARSEPDGAISSSPTSSLDQLNKSQDQIQYYKKLNLNNGNYHHSYSDTSESENRKIMQTQILSEFRQPQREYRDYPTKKHLVDAENPKQTTIHPKVTCKMPKSKAVPKHGSNNYRKDFANGIKTKSESSSCKTQSPQMKKAPNRYFNQFGPVTRF